MNKRPTGGSRLQSTARNRGAAFSFSCKKKRPGQKKNPHASELAHITDSRSEQVLIPKLLTEWTKEGKLILHSLPSASARINGRESLFPLFFCLPGLPLPTRA